MRRRALEAGLTKKVLGSKSSAGSGIASGGGSRYRGVRAFPRDESCRPAVRAALVVLSQRNADKVRASTAEESVRKWLAYREAQKLSEGAQIAARELSRRTRGVSGRRRKAIERSKDYGLNSRRNEHQWHRAGRLRYCVLGPPGWPELGGTASRCGGIGNRLNGRSSRLSCSRSFHEFRPRSLSLRFSPPISGVLRPLARWRARA